MQSRQSSGGFNTSMLQKAQEAGSPSRVKKNAGGDDSDSGWSDADDEPGALPPPPAVAQPPPTRNTSLKPAVTKAPPTSKPPPKRLGFQEDTVGSRSESPATDATVESNMPPAPPPETSEPTPNESNEDAGPPSPKIDTKPPEKVSTGNKITDMEIELEELRLKLQRAETKLAQHEKGVGALAREAELENQLEKAHSDLIKMKHEKNALKLSVKELQNRLTQAETGGNTPAATSSNNIGTVEAAMRRSEREKDLEKQLVKAKKDKDKALKLVIQLIGKERIADHLQQHAGEADVLDSLISSFSGQFRQGGAAAGIRDRLSAPPDMNHNSPGHKKKGARILGATRSPVATMGPAAFRSRIDEYFHTANY